MDSTPYDIRLIESFKILISGPSCCGKTTFVYEMLKNLNNFCKSPPVTIVCVYMQWQKLYDIMKNQKLVHIFLKDDNSVKEKIGELS